MTKTANSPPFIRVYSLRVSAKNFYLSESNSRHTEWIYSFFQSSPLPISGGPVRAFFRKPRTRDDASAIKRNRDRAFFRRYDNVLNFWRLLPRRNIQKR